MSELKGLKTDDDRMHVWMSIDAEGGWEPVVFGNMDPEKPYPIIARLPVCDKLFYFVMDGLEELSPIVVKEDRIFESMEDAIVKAEELANSKEWQMAHEAKMKSVVG